MGINDDLMEATKQLVNNPKKAIELLEGAKLMIARSKKPDSVATAVKVREIELAIKNHTRSNDSILRDILDIANKVKTERFEG